MIAIGLYILLFLSLCFLIRKLTKEFHIKCDECGSVMYKEKNHYEKNKIYEIFKCLNCGYKKKKKI